MKCYNGFTSKATRRSLSIKERRNEMAVVAKKERSDKLRRRPYKVRYFYLAVSRTTMHVGMSHGGLVYAHKNHGVTAMYLADLATLKVTEVKEPPEDFLRRWRLHYNEPTWEYAKDVEYGIPAPVEGA